MQVFHPEYTNHSIRATCIGQLDKGGFKERHITAISSHKNESTICTYSTKCPEGKKHEMYKHLVQTLIPKKAKSEPLAMMSKPKEASEPIGQPTVPSTISMSDLQNITNNTNLTKKRPKESLPQKH